MNACDLKSDLRINTVQHSWFTDEHLMLRTQWGINYQTRKQRYTYNLPELPGCFWEIEEHVPSLQWVPATRRPAYISMQRTKIAQSLISVDCYMKWSPKGMTRYIDCELREKLSDDLQSGAVCWAVARTVQPPKLSVPRYDLLIDQA